MGIFGPKMGTWSVHSNKDSRWNNNGRAVGLASSDGPQEMKDWVEKCKAEYGEPPDDAECSFYKD